MTYCFASLGGASSTKQRRECPARFAEILDGGVGNLTARLATRPNVYQVAGPHDRRAVFRYVFIEHPPHGDCWPVSAADYERLLAEWRDADGVRVLIDDGHVFLAEGALGDVEREVARRPALTNSPRRRLRAPIPAIHTS